MQYRYDPMRFDVLLARLSAQHNFAVTLRSREDNE